LGYISTFSPVRSIARKTGSDRFPGYKFESLSTLSEPYHLATRAEIESRPTLPVDTHAQFCSIVRTGIGSTTLLLAGEVDAIAGAMPEPASPSISPSVSAKQPAQLPYVELKTSQVFDANDRRSAEKFERKLCKFWAQSFLLGIPKVIVGFRSQAGYLQSIQEFETMAIPGMVKRGGSSWDGNVCVGFAAGVLEFLRSRVKDEGVVWRLRRGKGERILTLRKLPGRDGDGGIVEKTFRKWRESVRSGGQVKTAEEAEVG
jgi:RAT1-interacting protein